MLVTTLCIKRCNTPDRVDEDRVAEAQRAGLSDAGKGEEPLRVLGSRFNSYGDGGYARV